MQFNFNARFNKKNITFLRAVADFLMANNDQELANKLKNFIDDAISNMWEFNDDGDVVNTLCFLHSDKHMGKNSSKNSSVIYKEETHKMFCWSCKNTLSFFNFLTKDPVPREDDGTGDTFAINCMNNWCEIFEEIKSKYNGFLNLVNDPNFVYLNSDLFFTKQAYSADEITYLNLCNAIVYRQSKQQEDTAIEYIMARGFADRQFVKELHPFYLGKDIEEVKNNILVAISTRPVIFDNKSEASSWLGSLNILNENASSFINRVGLPIFKEGGQDEILNFNLRTISNDNPKYLYLAKEVLNARINKVLNNLDINNMHHVMFLNQQTRNIDGDYLYLTEGVYDALSWIFTGTRAACVFTKTITNQQQVLLKNKKVIFAFDNDLTQEDIHKKALLYPNGYYFFPPENINGIVTKDWNEILQKVFIINYYLKEKARLEKEGIRETNTSNGVPLRKIILNNLASQKHSFIDVITKPKENPNNLFLVHLENEMFAKSKANNSQYPYLTYMQLLAYLTRCQLYLSKENGAFRHSKYDSLQPIQAISQDFYLAKAVQDIDKPIEAILNDAISKLAEYIVAKENANNDRKTILDEINNEIATESNPSILKNIITTTEENIGQSEISNKLNQLNKIFNDFKTILIRDLNNEDWFNSTILQYINDYYTNNVNFINAFSKIQVKKVLTEIKQLARKIVVSNINEFDKNKWFYFNYQKGLQNPEIKKDFELYKQYVQWKKEKEDGLYKMFEAEQKQLKDNEPKNNYKSVLNNKEKTSNVALNNNYKQNWKPKANQVLKPMPSSSNSVKKDNLQSLGGVSLFNDEDEPENSVPSQKQQSTNKTKTSSYGNGNLLDFSSEDDDFSFKTDNFKPKR